MPPLPVLETRARREPDVVRFALEYPTEDALLRAGILAAALILGAPSYASAQDKCADATDQSTMTECAGDAFGKSDKQLNDLYRQVEKRLSDDADTRKLLGQAQRAWIKFRDAECDFQSSATAGGSARPMVIAMCMDSLTQARVKDLQGYLKCEQGDMSCPVPAAN